MAGHSAETISNETLWGGGRSPFGVSYGKLMMWLFLVSDALTFGGLLIAYGFERHAIGEWPVAEKVFEAFPGLGNGYPLLYVAMMTFILIISSVTMVLAVEAGHRLDKKAIIKWMILTVIGGLIFVGSQVWEWSHFIHGSGGYITTTSGEVYHFAEDYGFHEGDLAHMKWEDGMVLVENKYGEGERIHLTTEQSHEMFNDRADFYHGANLTRNEYHPGYPQYANFFFFVTGFHGFHVFSGVVINFLILLQVMRGAYDKRGHFEMVEKTGLYWHFVDLVWVFVFTFFYLV
ncbi:MAG: cytochrome c oxidase subunit 3 [Ulvibacter sp.]|jgi:cytochrome c oxidase subunit 3